MQILLMVAFCFLQTVMRYAFNNPLVWSEELTRFVFIWMVFTGAAVATCAQDHIRVDLFPKLMSRFPRGSIVLRCTISSIISVFLIFLFVIGLRLFNFSIQVSAALSIPWKYVYLAIPVGSLCMLLYEVKNILTSLLELMGVDPIFDPTDTLPDDVSI